jgi:hypothetical protein
MATRQYWTAILAAIIFVLAMHMLERGITGYVQCRDMPGEGCPK